MSTACKSERFSSKAGIMSQSLVHQRSEAHIPASPGMVSCELSERRTLKPAICHRAVTILSSLA